MGIEWWVIAGFGWIGWGRQRSRGGHSMRKVGRCPRASYEWRPGWWKGFASTFCGLAGILIRIGERSRTGCRRTGKPAWFQGGSGVYPEIRSPENDPLPVGKQSRVRSPAPASPVVKEVEQHPGRVYPDTQPLAQTKKFWRKILGPHYNLRPQAGGGGGSGMSSQRERGPNPVRFGLLAQPRALFCRSKSLFRSLFW